MSRTTPHCAVVEGGSFLSPSLRAACVGFIYLEPLRGWRAAGTGALRQKHIERYFLPFADIVFQKTIVGTSLAMGIPGIAPLKDDVRQAAGNQAAFCRQKSKAHNLKSKAHVLNYVPCFFPGKALRFSAIRKEPPGHAVSFPGGGAFPGQATAGRRGKPFRPQGSVCPLRAKRFCG